MQSKYLQAENPACAATVASGCGTALCFVYYAVQRYISVHNLLGWLVR